MSASSNSYTIAIILYTMIMLSDIYVAINLKCLSIGGGGVANHEGRGQPYC